MVDRQQAFRFRKLTSHIFSVISAGSKLGPALAYFSPFILGSPLESIKQTRTMQCFEWQRYEILSRMRATSVQIVVGEDWSGINHVSDVDRDDNQTSTGADREEIEFYDVTAS